MRMAHVTIRSAKKEETVAFYQRWCGLTIQREMGEYITFLADEKGATNIEIIREADHPVQASGISIGFEVPDAEGCREEMLRAGLSVTKIESPAPVVRFFFTEDPNGVRIQFVTQKL